MRSNKKRGMVLVMTMMAITLVLIMVHSLMQTTGLGLSGSSSFYDRESALQAAQSGMDYVVTKLQSNKAWRGDGNDEFGGFDSCGISVVESYGNVVGLLKNKTGTKSAFRVKFSFEDTSDATLSKVPCSRFAEGDGEEPKPDFSIAMPYVSINNLNNTSATIAYRANNNGKGLAKSTPNLEIVSGGGVTADYACHVPPQRIYVIVEGLSGKGLRDCEDPKSANTVANNNNSAIARRYVESYFTFNAPVLRGSAASAEKTINVAIANKMFIKTKGF
ncbi:pilus assembly PilX N-terminal domain-containing protein, partial [bacterium]|nr:pilus assembly PilX N-terminal domain-containing protein [bacterium]